MKRNEKKTNNYSLVVAVPFEFIVKQINTYKFFCQLKLRMKKHFALCHHMEHKYTHVMDEFFQPLNFLRNEFGQQIKVYHLIEFLIELFQVECFHFRLQPMKNQCHTKPNINQISTLIMCIELSYCEYYYEQLTSKFCLPISCPPYAM